MKKALGTILILCLCLSLGTAAMAAGFSDVDSGSWYYDNVTRMADMKALSGYPDGTFRPEGTISNGEFITVLMKTLTGTESYPSAEGHWAMGAMKAAVEQGVCAADELAESDLDSPITRAKAAKYTAKAVKKILKEDSVSSTGLDSIIFDWADVEASGCKDEILDMYARGIITGNTDGSFNPNGNIKRCEAATIVLRAYDKTIRQLPFGIAASLESVYADKGVFFLSCVGEKYDVKSLSVKKLTANGVELNIKCLNSAESYKELINASSTIRKAYEGLPAPDAVVKFSWTAADIKKLSDATQDGAAIIDFAFMLDVTLTDGSVLPFTYEVSYAIMNYGGLL